MNEKNNFLYTISPLLLLSVNIITFSFQSSAPLVILILDRFSNHLLDSISLLLKNLSSQVESTWRKWRCLRDIKKDPTRKLLVAADGWDSRIWKERENPLPGGGGSERELALKTRKKSRSPEELNRKENFYLSCYIKTYRVLNDFIWNMMLNKLWSVNWSW